MRTGIIFAAILIGLNLQAAPKPEAIHLTIVLTDGSVLHGSCPDTKVKVRTSYARLEIALSSIASIAFGKDHETITLKMKNKDNIRGCSDMPGLDVKTIVGQLKVPANLITSISVNGKKSKPGKGVLSAFMIEGKVGDYELASQFVKDVPESLAGQYERVTRSADTSGPIVGRHGQYPWLYPIHGKLEIPRSFVEKGKRYYPIWGTWKQRNDSGWRTNDENGVRIEGVTGRMYPHWETKVDYLVVAEQDNLTTAKR